MRVGKWGRGESRDKMVGLEIPPHVIIDVGKMSEQLKIIRQTSNRKHW